MRIRNLFLTACAASALASPALPYCQEDNPDGYVKLWTGAVRIEIFVEDLDGDRLPDEATCPGSAPVALVQGGSTSISCAGAVFDLYVGTAGNDVATATTAPWLFFGGPGDDQATGSTAGDYLHGGEGVDTLAGGDRADVLCPGSGDPSGVLIQLSQGGPGKDYLQGGPDNDELDGGNGDDSLLGSDGDDIVRGGDGDDYVSGGPGNDNLWGGADNDHLFGGFGTDKFSGDGGDDVILAQDAQGELMIAGGAGSDECFLDPSDAAAGCDLSHSMSSCSMSSLWVTKRNLGHLFEVDWQQGTVLQSGQIFIDSGIGQPYRCRGLAVDPTTCDLYGLCEDVLQDQWIVTIDPNFNLALNRWDASFVGHVTGDDLVDIGFNAMGLLGGLEKTGDVVGLIKSTGADAATLATAPAFDEGVALAFDAHDSGFWFITTEESTCSERRTDMVVPIIGRSSFGSGSRVVHPAEPYWSGDKFTANGDINPISGWFQGIANGDLYWIKRREFRESLSDECAAGAPCPVLGINNPDAVTRAHF